MRKQLQLYPRVERNCIEFMKCDWFLTPKFHYSLWGADLSPELCIIDPQSQAFVFRLHFSWRQDETWWQCRIRAKTRGTGGIQTMQIDINIHQLFQVQAGRNMYSVSSNGSCGFVTEQSKPLDSKIRAAVAFGILEFLLFVLRFCTCLYHVYRLYRLYHVPHAMPNSQSWKPGHFWIQSRKVNSGSFHEFSRKKSTTQRFVHFWHTFPRNPFEVIDFFFMNEIPNEIVDVSKSIFFSAALLQHRTQCMWLDSLQKALKAEASGVQFFGRKNLWACPPP